MATSVEIPLKEGDEVIEIPFDELPDGEEVLGILTQVRDHLNVACTATRSVPYRYVTPGCTKYLERFFFVRDISRRGLNWA
jgi:hypothetical protein